MESISPIVTNYMSLSYSINGGQRVQALTTHRAIRVTQANWFNHRIGDMGTTKHQQREQRQHSTCSGDISQYIVTSTTPHNNDEADYLRPLANFQPDLWQHTFLHSSLPDEVTKRQIVQEIEELKKLVRKELVSDNKDPKERLMYIDYIDRLGVAYHFEDEIEANLLNFHNLHYNDDCYKNDLHYVSLRFRILRQHGFRVSSDVFDELKNEEGRFNEENGVEAMLSLYEALHLRVHGEETLDEAIAYTRARLESFSSDINHPMAHQVTRALELPLFRRSPRLESTHQIRIYESESSHDDNLLKLAKLDFNLLQCLHKKELQHTLRWSKSLDFSRKLPYVRDRIVEGIAWNIGVYFEPKYSKARILFNKLFELAIIVDDTYDAYGVFHELQLFTQAILRWDKSYLSELPECMKFVYDVVDATFKDFEKDLANEGRSYAAHYLRLHMQALCRSYMLKAKWFHEKYVPTFEEYMRNGIVSAGYMCLSAVVFAGMGDVANKDAFEWINRPSSKSVVAASLLSRIMNDIGSHKLEQERGHAASAMECYMKQYGVTEEEAYEQLQLVLENAWKDTIEDMFRPTAIPMVLLTRVLNLSRVLYDFYKPGEDRFTMNHLMQAHVEALLVTPIKV